MQIRWGTRDSGRAIWNLARPMQWCSLGRAGPCDRELNRARDWVLPRMAPPKRAWAWLAR
jgi:hypothetical protein